MTSFSLSIHVGDVVHVLAVIEGAFDNPEPLMQDVLLVMIRSTQMNFVEHGRPDPWKDLAYSTLRRRFNKANKAKGKGKTKVKNVVSVLGGIHILRDSGLLMQSVGAGASGPFSTADGFGAADKESAVLGTNRPGWQNQFVDTRGWRPARVFMLFQVQDESDIGEMGIAFFTQTGAYAA